MKQRKGQITVPEPCGEDWDNMLSGNNDGKYCLSCQKTVFDFTGMSDEELIRFFVNRREEKTCGHFRKDQLNREILINENVNHTLGSKLAQKLATIFLFIQTILYSVTTMAQEKSQTEVVANQTKTQVPPIKGIVVDYLTKTPISNVKVELHNTPYSTITDINGKFTLIINEELSGMLTLNGYDTTGNDSFVIWGEKGTFDELTHSTVILYRYFEGKLTEVIKQENREYIVDGGAIYTGVPVIYREARKHTLWYRITNMFRKKK